METVKSAKRNLIDDILNDPKWEKYTSEKLAFEEFVNGASKCLNINIEKKEWNIKDPPDSFIWISGQKVGLEVTRLGDSKIIEKNEFFKDLNKISEEISIKYKYLLPKGNYLLYFAPTSNAKTSKSNLKSYLETEIPKFFKNFHKGNRKLKILDKNNEIGFISLSKQTENINGVKILFEPQGYDPLGLWNKNEFEKLIGPSINNKERKYNGKFREYPLWLLLSDVDGYTLPSVLDFDLKQATICSNVFERIFIIQIDYKDYPITELKVVKTTQK